jgi:hypothetical protein
MIRPYTVGAMSSIENRPTLNMQKPCSSCYIVAIGANLLYANGKTANINEGGWLHHVRTPGMAGTIDALANTYRWFCTTMEQVGETLSATQCSHLNVSSHPEMRGLQYELMANTNSASSTALQTRWVCFTT